MPPLTLALMESNLRRHGRPFVAFQQGDRVRGAGRMALPVVGSSSTPDGKKLAVRKGYSYVLTAAPGELPADFQPDLSPAEMLMMGVFEGKYLNDSTAEFPAEWFIGAMAFDRLSPEGPDPVRCNYFGIKSRQPLTIWRENGWAPSRGYADTDDRYHGLLGNPAQNPDERGWFQWYCRYWMGRRLPEIDRIQIGRWRAFRRHAGAIRANCRRGDLACRPRERQALLQWAYNPFI